MSPELGQGYEELALANDGRSKAANTAVVARFRLVWSGAGGKGADTNRGGYKS